MELTIEQTADLLGKSVRQIRYLIQQDRLPARKIKGKWRISSEDLPRSAGQVAARERRERGLRRAVEEALGVPEEPQRRYSVMDLKAFQVTLPLHQEAAETLGEDHPATVQLRRVLALLAQGCHRFDRTEKASAYDAARDAASLAICELVLTRSSEADRLRECIEQELMAALAGLLRRLKSRGRRS